VLRRVRLIVQSSGSIDVFSYNALIAAAAHASLPEFAEKWRLGILPDGHHSDVVSYNSVTNAWGKQGDASGAERIARLMRERDVEPDVVRCRDTWPSFALDGMPVRASRLIFG
jgi:pentatricopeptide repeat protein